MRTQRHNLGTELVAASKLLERVDKAAAQGIVGPGGDVALHELRQIVDRLLAIDAKTPLRFAVETADITDTEIGEVTGTQSRLVGDWWVDVPETVPAPASPPLPQQKTGSQILYP